MEFDENVLSKYYKRIDFMLESFASPPQPVVKRGRGRPRKVALPKVSSPQPAVKRGRGRPRKVALPVSPSNFNENGKIFTPTHRRIAVKGGKRKRPFPKTPNATQPPLSSPLAMPGEKDMKIHRLEKLLSESQAANQDMARRLQAAEAQLATNAPVSAPAQVVHEVAEPNTNDCPQFQEYLSFKMNPTRAVGGHRFRQVKRKGRGAIEWRCIDKKCKTQAYFRDNSSFSTKW